LSLVEGQACKEATALKIKVVAALGLWHLADGDTEIGKIDGRILWRRTLQKDNGDFKILERTA
jgi:hypothetical protein